MAPNSDDHAKCYSAVLRRLLCSGSLPTHPSDQLADTPAAPETTKPDGPRSNPGVVARLMGLESFPNSPRTPLGAFFRSRSVNSIDFISQFDPVKQHRRVRTSVSFREGMYHHREYISIDRDTRNKKQKNVIMKRPEVISREKLPAGRKKTVKSNTETKPKPRSGCKVHPQGVTPPAVRAMSPRRPSKISRPQSSRRSDNVEARGRRGSRRKKGGKEKRYNKMVEVICGLADESVSENWMYECEDFEGICEELEQEILHVLLKQLVDELVQQALWDRSCCYWVGFQT